MVLKRLVAVLFGTMLLAGCVNAVNTQGQTTGGSVGGNQGFTMPSIGSTQGAAAQPVLTLSKPSGRPGEQDSASGTGFPANATVNISVQAQLVVTGVTDSSGHFADLNFVIPESLGGFSGINVTVMAQSGASSASAPLKLK